MNDIIHARLSALSDEASTLIAERKAMIEQVQKIDIRLTQIASGIQELDGLLTASSQKTGDPISESSLQSADDLNEPKDPVG